MQIMHLQGLISAPFTPMDHAGNLNMALIPAYYEFLKANKVIGAFICGSTGEGPSLTTKEKMILVDAWASCTRDDSDFKVITLVGGTSVKECKELAIHAYENELYAIAMTAPFYYKPQSIGALAEICQAVASAVPEMPFYYYHIPVLTGVNFQMIDLLKTVESISNFAGIKYTHEDFMDFLSCLNFKNGKYDMLWGRDENMLPALSLGAKGAVGSTFNYAAPLYYDLIDAFNRGDLKEARQLQQQSIDMIRLLGKYGGIATGKAYMKLAGLDCGGFRLPVKNMTQEQFESFKRETENFNFGQYCSKQPIVN
jgi:N-acetylneuraminate lyase